MTTIAFDLDDTLLRGDQSISEYTVQTLHILSEQGMRILPASGRAMESMADFVRRLGCCTHFIACNGAEVWTADGRRIMAQTLDRDTARAVVDFGIHEHVYMQTYDGACFYYNKPSSYAESYARASFLTGVLTPDIRSFVDLHPTCKILMMDETEKISRMREEAGRLFAGRANVTTSKPSFLEINPPGASKGNALTWCASEMGFDMKETVCFGDSLNDLSMLQAAGLSVAVKNARPEVKEKTDLITEYTNDQDGVARFLHDRFLRAV